MLSAARPADALLHQLISILEKDLGYGVNRRLEALDELLNERYYWLPSHPQLTGAQAMVLLAELKRACLATGLHRISPNVRIAFILVDIFGYAVTAAAALVRAPEPAFRVRLRRARERLAEFLVPRCGHLDPHNPCQCEYVVRQALDMGFVTPPAVPQAAAHDTPPVADIAALYRSLPGAALDDAERERLLTLLANPPSPGG